MSGLVPTDPFPSSDFDDWAARYDLDVAGDDFPFTGYRRAVASLESAGAGVRYVQVSECAGVYRIAPLAQN